MTVCYAYEYEPCANSGKPCAGCGHYYWEHSHWLSPSGRRCIITKYEAMDHYDWHHASREPGADIRDRYQMMMDRTPGICKWVERVSARQFEDLKPPFVEMHSLNRAHEENLARIQETYDRTRAGYRVPARLQGWPEVQTQEQAKAAADVELQKPDPGRITYYMAGASIGTLSKIHPDLPEITTYGDEFRRYRLPNGAVLQTRIPTGPGEES